MPEDLMLERSELKYLFRSEEAGGLLRKLANALEDPSFRKEHHRITTVYLDRPDGSLARAALADPNASLKLRVRAYHPPEIVRLSPWVWVEIKERRGRTSRKSRFRLHKRWLTALQRGDLHPEMALAGPDAGGLCGGAAEAVLRLREIARGPLVALGATRYRRLALEGGTPLARLTIDQEVSYYRNPLNLHPDPGALHGRVLGPPSLAHEGAIVEVKVRGAAPPRWCEAALGGREPREYSKFVALAALAQGDCAERSIER